MMCLTIIKATTMDHREMVRVTVKRKSLKAREKVRERVRERVRETVTLKGLREKAMREKEKAINLREQFTREKEKEKAMNLREQSTREKEKDMRPKGRVTRGRGMRLKVRVWRQKELKEKARAKGWL